MRAVQPVESGKLRLQGFEMSYEVFGQPDAPPVLLLPAWQIVHSRIWKMQIPFLARSFRVVTMDPPGNGGGERTLDPAAFEYDRIVEQATGLLDHLGISETHVIGFSRGCDYGISMAARFSERVRSLILIGNGVSGDWQPGPVTDAFWERRDAYHGWDKRNAHYWTEHYADWLHFFFHQIFPEPHSTKAIDDAISWALETTPDVLIQTSPNTALLPTMSSREAIDRISCPVLIIHGDDDHCDPIEASHRLIAMRPDWSLVTMQGCGHGVLVRHPAQTNLLISDFLKQVSRHSAYVRQGERETRARA